MWVSNYCLCRSLAGIGSYNHPGAKEGAGMTTFVCILLKAQLVMSHQQGKTETQILCFCYSALLTISPGVSKLSLWGSGSGSICIMVDWHWPFPNFSFEAVCPTTVGLALVPSGGKEASGNTAGHLALECHAVYSHSGKIGGHTMINQYYCLSKQRWGNGLQLGFSIITTHRTSGNTVALVLFFMLPCYSWNTLEQKLTWQNLTHPIRPGIHGGAAAKLARAWEAMKSHPAPALFNKIIVCFLKKAF